MKPILEVVNVRAGYGESLVLQDLSLTVGEGEIVCLLGANGAGKTTTTRVVAGLTQAWSGDGGLTPSEVADVMSTLRRIHAAGTTMVLIEHLVHVIVDLCDQVLVMNFGRVLRQGTAADVVADPQVVEAYLGKPFDREGSA
jgi:ABC-type branched-subunit amino acid transport system ATPase component